MEWREALSQPVWEGGENSIGHKPVSYFPFSSLGRRLAQLLADAEPILGGYQTNKEIWKQKQSKTKLQGACLSIYLAKKAQLHEKLNSVPIARASWKQVSQNSAISEPSKCKPGSQEVGRCQKSSPDSCNLCFYYQIPDSWQKIMCDSLSVLERGVEKNTVKMKSKSFLQEEGGEGWASTWSAVNGSAHAMRTILWLRSKRSDQQLPIVPKAG